MDTGDAYMNSGSNCKSDRRRAGATGWWLRVITSAGALLALAPVAHAIGPTGPIGPQGPIGAPGGKGTPSSEPVRAAAQRTPPGTTGQGNRIEVTGNTASSVRCPEGSSASVNSVHVNGENLKGRTVIVQGRNAQDVHVDCAQDGAAPNGKPSSSVNSVNIR